MLPAVGISPERPPAVPSRGTHGPAGPSVWGRSGEGAVGPASARREFYRGFLTSAPASQKPLEAELMFAPRRFNATMPHGPKKPAPGAVIPHSLLEEEWGGYPGGLEFRVPWLRGSLLGWGGFPHTHPGIGNKAPLFLLLLRLLHLGHFHVVIVADLHPGARANDTYVGACWVEPVGRWLLP